MSPHKTILFCILTLMLLVQAACQKNNLKKSPLVGTWIELEKKSDTIVFSSEYDGQDPIFELKRGFRMSEGLKLPDYFSGPYWYRISGDSISLFWFASSGTFQNYYYKMLPDKSRFTIGNFFKNPEPGHDEKDTLVFFRIR